MCGRVFLAVVMLALPRFTVGLPQDESIHHNEEGQFPTDEFHPDIGAEDHNSQEHDRVRLQALQAELEEHLSLYQGEGEGAIPGEPEQDYPVFSKVPVTSFTCAGKHAPGYYADIEARCQAFHICDTGGAKHSFLCPGGSVFNQKYLVCDWWYGFTCQEAEDLFEDQREIYRLIQRETNNVKLSHNADFHVAEPFIDDAGQNNYVFLQNEVFQGAETGDSTRSKLENYRSHESNDKDTRGSFNDSHEASTSQPYTLSNRNNDANTQESIPNDTKHVRKQIKSVVRRKQYDQNINPKGANSEYKPNNDGEVNVELYVHRDKTQPGIHFENHQSNLNQPVT